MKHAASLAMFQYWNESRGRRVAPERGDINPGRIRTILADSVILTVNAAADHPFRLAGTRVCALFCRELKGEPFVRLWTESSRPLLRELVSIVTDEAVGVVASASSKMMDAEPLALELLLLPLYHRDRLDERLLGVLAPIAGPDRLGACPVELLELGAFRHVAPATETAIARTPVPGRDPRRRSLFVVHEGTAKSRNGHSRRIQIVSHN